MQPPKEEPFDLLILMTSMFPYLVRFMAASIGEGAMVAEPGRVIAAATAAAASVDVPKQQTSSMPGPGTTVLYCQQLLVIRLPLLSFTSDTTTTYFS